MWSRADSLYASLAADGAILEMASLFGARLVDRAVSSEVTLKFVEPFGDFEARRHVALFRAFCWRSSPGALCWK